MKKENSNSKIKSRKDSIKNVHFSKDTIDFLKKAGKQKNPNWLDKNEDQYQTTLKAPFISLAEKIKFSLQDLAPSYHFPSKGLGRIKRAEFKVSPGEPLFRNWISMIASPKSQNRFESNPLLFFGILPFEEEFERIILAHKKDSHESVCISQA